MKVDIRRHVLADDLQRWPVRSKNINWAVPEAMMAFLGAQSVAFLWSGYLSSIIWGDEIPPAAEQAAWTIPAISIGLWAGYLLFPMFMNRVTRSGPMIDFDLRISPAQVGVAAAIGVAVQLVVLPLIYFPILQVFDGDPGQSARELAATVDTPLEILFFFGSAVVIAPFVEEWFFRGMLLPALARRFNPLIGIIGSSLLFMLIHIRPIMFPGIFVLAVVLALLTMKTERLAPAIVAHMAFNCVTAVSLVYF